METSRVPFYRALFSLKNRAFIVKNILLHNACIAMIASKVIGDYGRIAFGLWHQIIFFMIVMSGQDSFNPGIYWKGFYMVKSKKTDTIGHLFSDPVKAG